MVLAKERFDLRGARRSRALDAQFVPFTAQTRMSGVDLGEPAASARARPTPSRSIVAGAGRRTVRRRSGAWPRTSRGAAARRWWWPKAPRVLGVIELKDIVKGGIKERFAELRRMGIKTVMITGDNPLTAAAIAAEAGVDDFLAEATPEAKLQADPRVSRPKAGWWR